MTVSETRVALRPFAPGDDAAVGPWLAEAVAAIDGSRTAAGMPSDVAGLEAYVCQRWPGALCAAVVVPALGVAGLLVWRAEAGERAATVILALAVRHDARNVGYGAEAVELLEAANPDARFLAAVPRSNGLALYFWLRVGYRPLALAEDPVRTRDEVYLWLVRASGDAVNDARSDP